MPGPTEPGRLHVGVHPLCRAAQRQFSQGDKVLLAEEVFQSLGCLRRHVDFALLKTFQQVLRRQVDQRQLVGPIENIVGHRLAHDDAADLGNDVVERLDVLHVAGRIDVDAGIQQLFDVLPALDVPQRGGVCVGQFIDQNQLRLARQGRIQVKLAQRRSAIGNLQGGKPLQPFEQLFGFRPPVRLDVADDDVLLRRACSLRASSSMEYVLPTPAE